MAVDDVVGLSIGTRPDSVGDDVLDMIAEFAKKTYITLEYGLQSIHDETLVRINRGHSADVFRDAVQRTRKRGIDVCVHIIFGLPGEDREDMLSTVRALAGMDIQAVKIHLCYVVQDTALHNLYRSGEYIPMTRDEYVDIVCDSIAMLPENVIIHRLTGDPHPEELIAPEWALEKQKNLQMIRDALAYRGIQQGMYAP